MRHDGGHVPGTLKSAAFSWNEGGQSEIPVLISAPHGGRAYSSSLRDSMRYADKAALKLEDRYVDQLAAAVAKVTGALVLIAHAPRAMIDLNRSIDDLDSTMLSDATPNVLRRIRQSHRARSGLGLIPRRLGEIGEIWNRPLSFSEVTDRIEMIHRPYHGQLETMLRKIRDRWGAALLLDLHSMPPLGVKHGAYAAPDFVIGDRFGSSCDPQLSARALSHLSSEGWLVAHNRPYSGGYVLDRHTAPRGGLHGLQLEICRATYLDDELKELSPQAETVIASVASLVRALVDEVIVLGGGHIRQAAE
ncbi:N-formylglutamate amidohydrolase [Altererythrobacter indicus]|uniref:N-formylglutamate amidohydrolase n=1 Tax=Altericroceibacterium indicum TaxID=374177 RepID=A0A845A5L9_9SPHN|nr:N-formylglutamate amidohydrolase [Altericroceibacterium indicum]MXP24857.1 N-formylglutamate amidohydrolase [Altericroceibacterium indicum]